MVIEQRLVEAVQQLSLSDVLQDVECARCHGVNYIHAHTHARTHTHAHTHTHTHTHTEYAVVVWLIGALISQHSCIGKHSMLHTNNQGVL